MKAVAEKRLFWFLKEGTELDLAQKDHLDMYIQQVLTRGNTSDVKNLFKTINRSEFIESFERIKHFMPKEVKMFWEEWLGYINKPAEKNS